MKSILFILTILFGCGDGKSEWKPAVVSGLAIEQTFIGCSDREEIYQVKANFQVGADYDRQLDWQKMAAIGPEDDAPTDCKTGGEQKTGFIIWDDLKPGKYVIMACVFDPAKSYYSRSESRTIELKDQSECKAERVKYECEKKARSDGLHEWEVCGY